MNSSKRGSALVDPKVHAQLAAPRASTRQSALESLAGLDPSVLAEHGPAIAARLEDKQKGVRLAALQALKRVPPDVLFDYAPAIMDRLDDVDNDVRDAAQELLELLDSATVLPPSTALQMRRLQDTDPSVRTVAIQALARESALLEKLAPVLVQSLSISRFHVRLGALEALTALSPHALDPQRDAVAKCLKDSHQQVRMAALRTLARLEPEDLAEVRRRLRPRPTDGASQPTLRPTTPPPRLALPRQVADEIAKLIDLSDPFLSEGAITTLTNLEPAVLSRYAAQISCCRFDEQPDVRQAASRAVRKMQSAGAVAVGGGAQPAPAARPAAALASSVDAAAEAWSETPD